MRLVSRVNGSDARASRLAPRANEESGGRFRDLRPKNHDSDE